MARAAYLLHNPQITGSNNPAYQISANAYNASHNEAGMLGFTPSTKALASNLLTPTDSITLVNPASGSTDTCNFISTSNTQDKDILMLFNANNANTITVANNVASPPAGSLSIFLIGGANKVLTTTTPMILMQIGSTGWYEIVSFAAYAPALNGTNSWTGSNTFLDGSFFIANTSDTTKLLAFNVASIASGTTRTLTVQNANGTLALLGTAQTWTAVQTFNSNISMNGANIALGLNQLQTTDFNISENGSTGLQGSILIQSSVTNGNSGLSIAPNGTSKISDLQIFRTGTLTTNYEMLSISSDAQGTGEFDIFSWKAGTGTNRPINIWMQSTKLLSFDTGNTITAYVNINLGSNEILFANGYFGIGSAGDAFTSSTPSILTTLTNQSTNLNIIPSGTNKTTTTRYWRTSADQVTNYEVFAVGTDFINANECSIVNYKGGTGSNRPINVYMQTTKLLSFDVANTVSLYTTLANYNNVATVGIGVPALYGLDNRSGLTSADGSATTLYAVPSGSGKVFRITADIFATAFTSGTATYTITWTENGVTRTLAVTATALNTLGTATDLINPDASTNITGQLTGVFVATVKVVGLVEQIA